MSFWFHNKFPAISLCLVIELTDEHPTELKFRPIVFINGNKQSHVCQRVSEFMIETDHILLLNLKCGRFRKMISGIVWIILTITTRSH